jgi:hypothetical protein
MIDLLDILAGRAAETNPATYYESRPNGLFTPNSTLDLFSLENDGVPIDYETLDPMSYQLRTLFGDVTDKKGKMLAIKTRDQQNYVVDGYIATQDGSLYVIDAVTVDTSAASKQAMRFIPVPLETVYILRLFEVENTNRTRRG